MHLVQAALYQKEFRNRICSTTKRCLTLPTWRNQNWQQKIIRHLVIRQKNKNEFQSAQCRCGEVWFWSWWCPLTGRWGFGQLPGTWQMPPGPALQSWWGVWDALGDVWDPMFGPPTYQLRFTAGVKYCLWSATTSSVVPFHSHCRSATAKSDWVEGAWGRWGQQTWWGFVTRALTEQ